MTRIAPIFLLLFVMTCGMFAADSVAPLNDSLYLSVPVVVDNVTVWPVYSKKAPEAVGEYLTLNEAQQQNLAIVRETGAPAATSNDNGARPQPAARSLGGEKGLKDSLL